MNHSSGDASLQVRNLRFYLRELRPENKDVELSVCTWRIFKTVLSFFFFPVSYKVELLVWGCGEWTVRVPRRAVLAGRCPGSGGRHLQRLVRALQQPQ